MLRIFFALCVFVPVAAWATPRQVTLFPDSALVEETCSVELEQHGDTSSKAIVTIPGQADPSSLRFSRLREKTAITDVSWTERREPHHAALVPLQARLEKLTSKHDALTGELEATLGRLQFWKAQTEPAQRTVAALRELASELSRNLRADKARVQILERDLAQLNTDIAQVREQIAQIAGQGRTVWDIRVLFSGAPPKELSYSYVMRDCGWEPVYRLEALPDRGGIAFSWQAKIWQRSGMDWQNIHLMLATMRPDMQTAPHDLPPWEITPVEVYARKAMAAPAAMELQVDAAVGAAPVAMETRRATYALWDMNRRHLPAGETRILEIKRQMWDARFTHLVRPSLGPHAFVRAHTTFSEPREFPPGKAQFLVDGAMLDQREFALSGREATLFFGINPLLRCETTLTDKKTGETGLFHQKQRFVREWIVKVFNDAAYPALVRVEEPRPQVRDERISLTVDANPAPLDEANPALLAWNATVDAGKQMALRVDVQFEAPEDMRVNPGWMW